MSTSRVQQQGATARVADILVGDIGWQKLACADTVSASRVQQQVATARVADILVGDIGWQKVACADTLSTSRVQQQGATARVLTLRPRRESGRDMLCICT